MKFKKILLVSGLGLLSMISCFASEINANATSLQPSRFDLKCPYENITIDCDFKYESRRSSRSASMNGGLCGICKIGQEPTDSFSFVLSYIGENQKVKLPSKSYDAAKINGIVTEKRVFEEFFSINNKSGKIVYKVNVEYGVRGRKHSIIKAIQLEVLHVSLDGVECKKC